MNCEWNMGYGPERDSNGELIPVCCGAEVTHKYWFTAPFDEKKPTRLVCSEHAKKAQEWKLKVEPL